MVKRKSDQTEMRIKAKAAMSASKPLLIDKLPQIQGQILTSGSRAQCPLHGCSGIQTTWAPPSGIDPAMVEYACEFGHAFYIPNRRSNV